MQTVNVNEVSSTNYLSPDVFYNKFLFWLVRLQPFASGSGKPPMSAKAFVVAFRVQYGCGLRVSELLNIRKKDLNLKRCILYYPTISVPARGWLRRTLLYWDEIGSRAVFTIKIVI